MTHPTLTSSHSSRAGSAAGTDRAERDRDWHATTGEAIARIDDAIAAISAHLDAVDDDHTRGHATGVLTAVVPALERLAERLTAPIAGDHEHPY